MLMFMRTIKDIINVLNTIAFKMSRGYNEFSHSPMQSWSNGFRGTRLNFMEYSMKRPDSSCFVVNISSMKEVEFIDSRDYALSINDTRISFFHQSLMNHILDDMLYSTIDEARIPMRAKQFLRELDETCIGIMQRQMA